MSPRETLVAETREWLERSRADLQACDVLIDAGLPAEALFHAQQCAEKAMKPFSPGAKFLSRRRMTWTS